VPALLASCIPIIVLVADVHGMCVDLDGVRNIDNIPHAVLIRALEPLEGIATKRKRRRGRPDHQLANGPGKLCAALGIDRTLDGVDLLGDRAWIEAGRARAGAIAAGPRVGIDYAAEWANKPWRFWIRDNRFVSRSPSVTRPSPSLTRPSTRAARRR